MCQILRGMETGQDQNMMKARATGYMANIFPMAVFCPPVSGESLHSSLHVHVNRVAGLDGSDKAANLGAQRGSRMVYAPLNVNYTHWRRGNKTSSTTNPPPSLSPSSITPITACSTPGGVQQDHHLITATLVAMRTISNAESFLIALPYLVTCRQRYRTTLTLQGHSDPLGVALSSSLRAPDPLV